MNKANYIKPKIKEKKLKLSFFYRNSHWFDDASSMLIQDVYANTIWLPYISNNP